TLGDIINLMSDVNISSIFANAIRPVNILYRFNMVFFVVSWPATHVDLHSFPTRRSSDLARDLLERHRADRRAAHQAVRRGARARSEEHTSELQSPYDVVCRLLLEKKKPGVVLSNSAANSDVVI